MNLKSFTLLELLLGVAIVTTLFGLSIPFYRNFQTNSDFERASSDIRQNLYRAQNLSKSASLDSEWAIDISGNSVTIFKGSVFVTRDQTYDEITKIPSTIQVTGDSRVIFDKLYGKPDSAKLIQISSTVNNKTFTIDVSAQGTID
jgi:type II secretory pathway pseudopilin PulG